MRAVNQMAVEPLAGHAPAIVNAARLLLKRVIIRDDDAAFASGDPTVLANNYGTLPNNRTHIFNVAYVYEFPKVANANGFVKQLANGWQISGIGQYQTGADLQASVSSNFGYSAFLQPGATFM